VSAQSRPALVTGGAGFIGSHLVDRLVQDGWRVRVLDDFSSGREENLAAVRSQVELLRGDVCDPDAVAKAVERVEVVFHLAAVASVPRSVGDPLGTDAINLGGTLRILDAARRAGARRVVFASTSAAYGESPELPKRESLPVDLASPYALQKHAAELLHGQQERERALQHQWQMAQLEAKERAHKDEVARQQREMEIRLAREQVADAPH